MIQIKQTKRMLKPHRYKGYDGNKNQSHSSRKPENDNIKIKSNGDTKSK